MTYATLMVHLELGCSNAGLLKIAGDLAEHFHAGVVGIAACQPLEMLYADGYISGAAFELDRAQTAEELKAAEAEFHAALHGRIRRTEWRCAEVFAVLSGYVVKQARSADLILTGIAPGHAFDSSRAVNTGDLVMQAGRPVLVVPTGATSLKPDRVLIAWKDTSATRRAVADALPLLKRARSVSVVELVSAEKLPAAAKHVGDVVAWLEHHDINAEGTASLSTGDDAAGLDAFARDKGIDIVVAGAYGHSRLREWVLGGVTRDLLLNPNRCSFLSH